MSQNALPTIRAILEGAFFSPLRLEDWPAFLFGQPGLLGLEDEEAFDLFVRAAVVAQTVHPEQCQEGRPLEWLFAIDDHAVELAHALAEMRVDRPLLFHRMLLSLPAVSEGRLDPRDFDVVEDFLASALHQTMELRQAAAAEIDVLAGRGLRAAGLDPDNPPAQLAEAAAALLARPEARQCHSDLELLFWLTEDDQRPADALALGAVVEAWRRWAEAASAQPQGLGLLRRLLPALDLDAADLAEHSPAQRQENPVITAQCPFCGRQSSLALGRVIKELTRCPHLIFVGTSDEAHLFEALRHFALGRDVENLLESYYNSPDDLDLYATFVNDMCEMLIDQGRLDSVPVACESAPKAFHYLRAYFARQNDEDEPTKH